MKYILYKSCSSVNDLENQLKDFLNKNNEFGFSDTNSQPDYVLSEGAIPLSCWSFQNDCQLNCISNPGKCLKKFNKMSKDDYHFCCYLMK